MKTSLPFSLVFIVSLLQICEQARSVSLKDCKKVQADITKRQLKGIAACTKAMHFKNGKDRSLKMNCIVRCVMIKEKFLNEDGQTNPEYWGKYVKEQFPEGLQSHFNATLYDCMTIAFEGFKSPEEDENCTSYDPYMKCVMAKASDLCSGLG